jgi:hypothetical protein
VTQYIGPFLNEHFYRLFGTVEVGRQNFDKGLRVPTPDGGKGSDEMLCTSILKVISRYRSDYDKRQFHQPNCP